MRTPTGIVMSPHRQSLNSFIEEIEIIPRLHIYSLGDVVDQSWTTFVKGTVDFANSAVDLTVQNARVAILFSKRILLAEEYEAWLASQQKQEESR